MGSCPNDTVETSKVGSSQSLEEIVRRFAVLATAAVAVGLLTTGCSSTDEAQQTTENANAAV